MTNVTIFKLPQKPNDFLISHPDSNLVVLVDSVHVYPQHQIGYLFSSDNPVLSDTEIPVLIEMLEAAKSLRHQILESNDIDDDESDEENQTISHNRRNDYYDKSQKVQDRIALMPPERKSGLTTAAATILGFMSGFKIGNFLKDPNWYNHNGLVVLGDILRSNMGPNATVNTNAYIPFSADSD